MCKPPNAKIQKLEAEYGEDRNFMDIDDYSEEEDVTDDDIVEESESDEESVVQDEITENEADESESQEDEINNTRGDQDGTDESSLEEDKQAENEDQVVEIKTMKHESAEDGTGNKSEIDLLLNEDLEVDYEDLSRPLFQDSEENAALNSPLDYNNEITAMDHLLRTLALGIRFNHTYENILHQLNLIKCCFQNINLPTTEEQMQKVLGRDKENTICRLYCSMCKEMIAFGISPSRHCACGRCGPGKQETFVDTFIQIRLGPQLKELLNLPNMAEALRYKFTRRKINPDGIEDIYDGQNYKRLEQEGQFLSNPHNLSMTLWTDKVKISEPLIGTAYPVLLQVNELNPCERKKHLLLAGIWVGRGDPGILSIILLPVVQDIKFINNRGVTWILEGSGEVTTRFIVVMFTANSPVKLNACRIERFNGKCGCPTCLAPGQSIDRNRRVYPADSYPLRTDINIRRDAVIAYTNTTAVNGVKGCSALTALSQFDLADGVVVDVCHLGFIGVAKQWLTRCLNDVRNPYYIGHQENLHTIDDRLCNIKTPSIIFRPPQSIMTYNQWKTSEWRNWVLYYSLPCLSGILPGRYLQNWRKFVDVMFTLTKSSISDSELVEAEATAESFVQEFESLFGLQNMTLNIHSLKHIALSVRHWGPLWAYSTYFLESFNQQIVKVVTTPHNRAEEIITRFLMKKFILLTIREAQIVKETKSAVEELLNVTVLNIPRGKAHYFVGEGIATVRHPTEEELVIMRNAKFPITPKTELSLYQKAVIHGVKYEVYDDVVSETCDFVVYSRSRFWKICSLLSYEEKENTIYGFIGQKMEDRGSLFGTSYIRRVSASVEKEFIPFHKIVVPGILIRLVGGDDCAIPLSNFWEIY